MRNIIVDPDKSFESNRWTFDFFKASWISIHHFSLKHQKCRPGEKHGYVLLWFNLKHYTLNRNPSNLVYKYDNVLASNFILLHPPFKK
jgi:hypothetical protein